MTLQFSHSVGDLVQIHPALDDWMKGDRFGTVVAPGRVKLHKSGKIRRIADNLIVDNYGPAKEIG